MKPRQGWLAIREPLTPHRGLILKLSSFLIPLVVWCFFAYVPWTWAPKVRITSIGDSDIFNVGDLFDPADFAKENAGLIQDGLKPGTGVDVRVRSIFLPTPTEVLRSFYVAFKTPPLKDQVGLSQSLWHSVQVIFWGFITSAILGVPMGVLAGTFDFFSKLFEPFVDFIRYMPAPAFGAICIAALGIDDGPKIAIIWIGTFFQMVLIVANTTRQLDIGLLEAAQTLGAKRSSLVTRVILPGIMPNLYNDMRILIGWAWTYLIVAELIGSMSGISAFIYQQREHFHYNNVFMGIILIGIVGLVTDQFLAAFGQYLFPYLPRRRGNAFIMALFGAVFFLPQRVVLGRSRDRRRRRTELAVDTAPSTEEAATAAEANPSTESVGRMVDAPVA